jgi:hypothetical protein
MFGSITFILLLIIAIASHCRGLGLCIFPIMQVFVVDKGTLGQGFLKFFGVPL